MIFNSMCALNTTAKIYCKYSNICFTVNFQTLAAADDVDDCDDIEAAIKKEVEESKDKGSNPRRFQVIVV